MSSYFERQEYKYAAGTEFDYLNKASQAGNDEARKLATRYREELSNNSATPLTDEQFYPLFATKLLDQVHDGKRFKPEMKKFVLVLSKELDKGDANSKSLGIRVRTAFANSLLEAHEKMSQDPGEMSYDPLYGGKELIDLEEKFIDVAPEMTPIVFESFIKNLQGKTNLKEDAVIRIMVYADEVVMGGFDSYTRSGTVKSWFLQGLKMLGMDFITIKNFLYHDRAERLSKAMQYIALVPENNLSEEVIKRCILLGNARLPEEAHKQLLQKIQSSSSPVKVINDIYTRTCAWISYNDLDLMESMKYKLEKSLFQVEDPGPEPKEIRPVDAEMPSNEYMSQYMASLEGKFEKNKNQIITIISNYESK